MLAGRKRICGRVCLINLVSSISMNLFNFVQPEVKQRGVATFPEFGVSPSERRASCWISEGNNLDIIWPVVVFLLSLSLNPWSIFSLGACCSSISPMVRAWHIILGVSLSDISWLQCFSTMPFVPMAVAMCAALTPWCWHNCFWSCAFHCIGEALFFFKGKSLVVTCHIIWLIVNLHSNVWWFTYRRVTRGAYSIMIILHGEHEQMQQVNTVVLTST